VPQSVAMALTDCEPESLVPALREVADALGSFDLRHSGRDRERLALRASIRDYLVPRLLDPEGPLVVAVIGGSGSGKTTLVNSLAGRALGAAGPLRPTTLTPLVWTGDGLPPTLAGFRSLMQGEGLVSDPPPPEGLVLVDTPAPEIEDGGAPIAAAVIGAADACIFVASAGRYADVIGWDLIGLAARRGLPSVFVLNRVPGHPETAQMLREDLIRRLASRGLIGRGGLGAVVDIEEGPILAEGGGLPREWITGLRKEVAALGEPLLHREILHRVVTASLDSLERGLTGMRGAVVDEALLHIGLGDTVRRAYRSEADLLDEALRSGALSDFGGDDPAVNLAAVAARRASRAARGAASGWEDHPAGAPLLTGRPDLWVHGVDTVAYGRKAVAAWADALPGAVREASPRRWMRRRTARAIADALRRAAVDFRHRPEPSMLRRLPGFEARRRLARDDLETVLRRVLDHDAERFAATRGESPSGDALSRLWLEDADA